MDERVPVTIVTGWQDATTGAMIDHLVEVMGADLVAVVGRRTSSGSQAPAFLVETEPEISERSAGCACCTLRSDLVRIGAALTRRKAPPAWILVEAAGWTDPVVAAQTFLTDPGLASAVRLDGIVTVLDGPATGARLLTGLPAWPEDVAGDQVAVADRIVVSGVSAMTPAAWTATTKAAAAVNQRAQVVLGDVGDVGHREVVGLDAFGPKGVARTAGRTGRCATPEPTASAALVVEASGRLDQNRFQEWMGALRKTGPHRLLRLEGALAIGGRDRQMLCQGMGNALDHWRGRRFAPAELRVSRLVVTGRHLDGPVLQMSLADCVAP